MTETNLVKRIAAFIERFVFCEDKQIYQLLALWVVQTHCYKDFEFTGYVLAHSTEPGSGKSRLLEVLSLLVKNPSSLLKPTDASLFRTADNSTQLLDEIDAWTNGENLRSVLNSGFQRGGTVTRNEKEGEKWKPVRFPVYAPRAMAGVGNRILHGTTRDRTFAISMTKQPKDERREKFRARTVKPEADQLRNEIDKWASENRSAISALYDDAGETFRYLEHLEDRTIDIAEPLAAILEIAYKDTLEIEARRFDLLEAISVTRKEGEELLEDHKILNELLRLANGKGAVIGNASELAAMFEFTPRPTEYQVAATLHRYGFESRSIRLGDSVRHRYELSRERLGEICSRFGGSNRKQEVPEAAHSPTGSAMLPV